MADRNQGEKRSPEQHVRALYEDAESNTARAFEEFVSKPSFGALLARSAENVAALTRIGSDVADLVVRNLRIAGRTEDKLERVLQEVEQLRDELGHRDADSGSNGGDPQGRKPATAKQ
jgi:hypothetical protein